MKLYLIRTNSEQPTCCHDFIYFNDFVKAKATFEIRCREIQEQNNLPKEAVDKCIKLNYLDAAQILNYLNLPDGTDDDFCSLEEITLEEWLDPNNISTYFDFAHVDDLLKERNL